MSDTNVNVTTNKPLSQLASVSAWTSYTPTGDFTTNTTYSGYWRRVGDSMQVRIDISFSGAPNSVSLVGVSIPATYTIDTSKLPSSVAGQGVLGITACLNSGVATYQASQVVYRTTTTVQPYTSDGGVTVSTITEANPFSFGNGDKIHMFFEVPIVEFA